MKASVDKDKCIGYGLCESICPEVFKLGTDGKSEVVVDVIDENLEANCLQAAENCPISDITIINENKITFPTD